MRTDKYMCGRAINHELPVRRDPGRSEHKIVDCNKTRLKISVQLTNSNHPTSPTIPITINITTTAVLFCRAIDPRITPIIIYVLVCDTFTISRVANTMVSDFMNTSQHWR